MRRPRTTFSSAVVAIALSAATGIQAQQPVATKASAAPSAKPATAPESSSPMLNSRGARQLLRNGEDFLNYGEYGRALDYLREAENKQFELTAQERTKLNSGILRAKRGLRGMDDGTVASVKGRRAPARRPIGSPSIASTANRPGAIVLEVPRDDEPLIDDRDTIQLTSATREELAPAPRRPVANLPELPPLDSLVPSEAPEPLSAPAEFTPPASLSDSPPPIIAPPDLAVDERPAPPALSVNVQPAPATSADVPLSDDIAPVALAQSIKAPAMIERPKAAPTPVAAELPPPILLEEEEVPAAQLAPAAPRPSKKVAAKPVADDLGLPPLVVNEAPSPAEELAAPVEVLPLPEFVEAPDPVVETPLPEPVMRTAQAVPEVEPEPAPAAAPAPIAEEAAIEPPPAAEASSIELPPLPETPAGVEPPSISLEGVKSDSLRDQATAALSEYKRPSLSEDAKRRVEQIARRQQDDANRNPVPPMGTSFSNAGMFTTDDLASNRLELPRAPAAGEIRPIRAIPIPEEFVPLIPRQWTPSRKAWTAAATGHGPLYFQDAVLERYGQSVEHAIGSKGRFLSYPLDDPRESNQRNQILQPFYSIGLFASQLALWPYNLVVDPPWEAEYDLGYYRPGDRVPPDTTYFPFSGVGPPLRGRRY